MRTKIYILIIALLLFTNIRSYGKTVENLYLIDNATRPQVEKFINEYLKNNKYNFSKNNDTYIINTSTNNDETYNIVIKQEKSHCYLYGVGEKTKLTEKLIKEMKNGNFPNITEQSEVMLEKFVLNKLNVPDDVISSYDFSDEAQRKYDMAKKNTISTTTKTPKKSNATIFENNDTSITTTTSTYRPKTNDTILKGKVVRIPAGTSFEANIQSDISTGSMAKNDRLTAVLKSDWIYKGTLIAPAGSIIYGNVVKAKSAGLAYGNGNVTLNFNQILLPSGTMFGFASNDITLAATAKRAGKIVKDVVVGAAIGTVLGLITGAISKDMGSHLLVGASVGAASGGIKAVTTRGENVDIKENTSFKVKLKEDLNIATDY